MFSLGKPLGWRGQKDRANLGLKQEHLHRVRSTNNTILQTSLDAEVTMEIQWKDHASSIMSRADQTRHTEKM
ncbi:hypothetical protein J4Q44_G00157240 [Coregonus suidteri]|uniref:Uncharacterized protein n=1 Tax=Coregonus suidteri TaxID=861788 RepID=A0AAN8LLQ2_9TELE